jgi:hypothetical protein
MGERADIQSRIASAGMVLIPEEIDFTPAGAEEQAADEDAEGDPAQTILGETMMAAIGNPGDASQAVPVVVRGPAHLLHPDMFRHLRFYDPMGSVFASQREEAIITRISIGLELPVEEIKGLSVANHWGAFMIDEDRWRYVEPTAEMLVADLTAGYLRPVAEASGIQNWQSLSVDYDNSELVTDPDRGKTAITLHKDGMLKATKTLEVNGFDADEDLMDEEEHAEWLAIQLRSPELAGVEVEPVVSDADVSEPDTEDDDPAAET